MGGDVDDTDDDGADARIVGVDALVVDARSFADFAIALMRRARALRPGGGGGGGAAVGNVEMAVRLLYTVDASSIQVTGHRLMCDWRLESQGLVALGLPSEVGRPL